MEKITLLSCLVSCTLRWPFSRRLVIFWSEVGGLEHVLVQAGITTPGTADSFLKASHVTCTRQAHQVSLHVLWRVQQGSSRCNATGWLDHAQKELLHVPMHLQQLELYSNTRGKLPALYRGPDQDCWFFALDHTWIPVHLHDMVSLNDCIRWV
jgi:hypothetical protein